jgi:GTP-binding protein
MFIDEADITVRGGRGGRGCVSFRREKYVPLGGPDGGDGGDGGSVYCLADLGLNTLYHLSGKHHWTAEGGGHGQGKNRHGRNGGDVLIRLPAGTVVRDADQGTTLKDLVAAEERVCLARGGRGGRGNAHFATPSDRAPRRAEPGEPGQVRRLHLELKLIADVGLVGQPNAGKSTLLRRVSAARPKVAAYPFTTLQPVLGIVDLPGERRFVMADLPGLIEGAHRGTGLGDAFLRHIERTRLLVHLVDICPTQSDPVRHYRDVNRELHLHSAALGRRPQVVVANKMDLTGSRESLRRFSQAIGVEVVGISAATGAGVPEMLRRLWRALHPHE